MGRRVPGAVEQVKAELDRRGWTQNEFARQVGADSGIVSRWMTGRNLPGLEMALKIESLLGIPARAWVEAA
jgi:transcriptional regulator with XRE-family HTH domain